MRGLWLLTSVLWPLCSPAFAAEADVLFLNAKVFSGKDVETPQALAIRGNRILAVGAVAEAARGSSTTVVDLEGRWVLPGFNDAHVHFLDGGLAAFAADLSTAASAGDAAAIVAAFAAGHPADPWVLGRGWAQTSFPGGAYPTKADLDAVLPDRPALLEDEDGHQYWANSAALKAAGLSSDTGIFIEGAAEAIQKAVPEPTAERRREALLAALESARKCGVTSVQGLLAHDERGELQVWRELVAQGSVTIRYFMWGRLEDPQGFLRLKAEFADLPGDRFTFGGVKGFVDGVIGPRTAALGKPYSDAPETYGTPNYDQQTLNKLVFDANRRGLQVELHAVGDAAVRMALDAFAASARKLRELPGAKRGIRNKVEHAELLDSRDLSRFRELDVTASMQPSHMTYDTQSQNYNDARLGSRVRWAFAWRSLHDAGAPLAFGTDWPVMPLDPRVGLFAAVTRTHFDGTPAGGWVPSQRLSLPEAVLAYTAGSAYAEARERELGALRPGMLADLVVTPADFFGTQGAALLRVPVERVFFDGKQLVGPD